MIVDRFEILHLDNIRAHAMLAIERRSNIAHHVLHKFGVLICTLCDEFFIHTLEQPINLAGTAAFCNGDQILNLDRL